MLITLKNPEIEVQLLQFGASIHQIKTKNKNGELGNIVLTHKNVNEYETGNDMYAGTTCGRVAGRIENATFSIGGESYTLDKNFANKHNLHGGVKALSHAKWEYVLEENFTYDNKSASRCEFKIKSSHLDNGFPANVEITVEYILVDKTLIVNYYGTSDRKTYLNLTNHSYFNLGDSNTIKKHYLTLDCDNYVKTDTELIPQELCDVTNTEYDFRNEKMFGNLECKEDSMLKTFLGYDSCFMLNKKSDYDLVLEDKESGRLVKINTTYPSVVLYTYNFPSESELLNRKNIQYAAVAIEPQYPPNAMNSELFNIPLVDENNPYKETIRYEFNCK